MKDAEVGLAEPGTERGAEVADFRVVRVRFRNRRPRTDPALKRARVLGAQTVAGLLENRTLAMKLVTSHYEVPTYLL